VADPLTLVVLGGVAATEGIKFLYGQAAEVLKGWRERRHKNAGPVDVPIVANDVLDAAPTTTVVDPGVVEREQRELVRLVGALSPYAQGIADIAVTDAELGRDVQRLRQLLEAAYGQRLTFRGEDRPPTGSRIDVTQVVELVEGAVTGVDVGEVDGGADVTIDQRVDQVAAEGTVTGFKADRLK